MSSKMLLGTCSNSFDGPQVAQGKDDGKRRWASNFGTTPAVCVFLWKEIDPLNSMPRGAQPKHLLWALYFLKVYPTEEQAVSLDADEKTFRKWSEHFVMAISFLEFKVVSPQDFFVLGYWLHEK